MQRRSKLGNRVNNFVVVQHANETLNDMLQLPAVKCIFMHIFACIHNPLITKLQAEKYFYHYHSLGSA